MRFKRLDAVRGFAAVYVAMGHFVISDVPLPPIVKFPFRFGQEAVILFFLLSGFVIATSLTGRARPSARSYYVHRFRRIYPLVLIAFALSAGVQALNRTSTDPLSWTGFLGNLAMLQDWDYAKPGVWFGTFLGNDPLWSLSYEWWFYILAFPLLGRLARSRWRLSTVLAISLASWTVFVLFPNHLALIGAYLVIWWAGLELALFVTRPVGYEVVSLRMVVGSLGVMVLAAALPLVASHGIDMHGGRNPGVYPYLTLRHFAMALFAVLGAIIWWRMKFVLFDRSVGLFAIFAPVSYALYLFHYPLLVQLDLSSYLPIKEVALGLQVAGLGVLAYLAEVKLQPLVNRVLRA